MVLNLIQCELIVFLYFLNVCSFEQPYLHKRVVLSNNINLDKNISMRMCKNVFPNFQFFTTKQKVISKIIYTSNKFHKRMHRIIHQTSLFLVLTRHTYYTPLDLDNHIYINKRICLKTFSK